MAIDHCPWYVAGPILGLPMVGLRAALNKPFGALGGYIDLATARKAGAAPSGFRLPLLVGIVIGGALYAITTGTFSMQGMLARRRIAGQERRPVSVEAPGTAGL